MSSSPSSCPPFPVPTEWSLMPSLCHCFVLSFNFRASRQSSLQPVVSKEAPLRNTFVFVPDDVPFFTKTQFQWLSQHRNSTAFQELSITKTEHNTISPQKQRTLPATKRPTNKDLRVKWLEPQRLKRLHDKRKERHIKRTTKSNKNNVTVSRCCVALKMLVIVMMKWKVAKKCVSMLHSYTGVNREITNEAVAPTKSSWT